MPYLFSALYMAVGLTCVFTAIALVNNVLLPNWLMQETMWRAILFSPWLTIPSFYFIEKGYAHGGAVWGGVFYMLCVLVAVVTYGLLVEGKGFNLFILSGFIVANLRHCLGELKLWTSLRREERQRGPSPLLPHLETPL